MNNDLLKAYEGNAMNVAALVETLYDGVRNMHAPDSEHATTDDLQAMRQLNRLLTAACRIVNEYS